MTDRQMDKVIPRYMKSDTKIQNLCEKQYVYFFHKPHQNIKESAFCD